MRPRRGKTVMLDCGIHPGFSGEHSLPYFDEVDLDSVDLLLVTHFHLDHCAAVPYIIGKTVFKVGADCGPHLLAWLLVCQRTPWALAAARAGASRGTSHVLGSCRYGRSAAA